MRTLWVALWALFLCALLGGLTPSVRAQAHGQVAGGEESITRSKVVEQIVNAWADGAIDATEANAALETAASGGAIWFWTFPSPTGPGAYIYIPGTGVPTPIAMPWFGITPPTFVGGSGNYFLGSGGQWWYFPPYPGIPYPVPNAW